jgi:hypothetical protein
MKIYQLVILSSQAMGKESPLLSQRELSTMKVASALFI